MHVRCLWYTAVTVVEQWACLVLGPLLKHSSPLFCDVLIHSDLLPNVLHRCSLCSSQLVPRISPRSARSNSAVKKQSLRKKKPAVKDSVFYPADDFVSRENAVRFIFEAIEYKAFKLLAVGRITCILKSTVISRGGRVKSLRTCCVSCHGFWAFHMSTNSFFWVLDMQQLTKAGAHRFS